MAARHELEERASYLAERPWDVVVAGNGPAGASAAITAKTYNPRLRVLVLDKNPRYEAGKKHANGYTCGDATSDTIIKILEKLFGIKFDNTVLANRITAIDVYPPDFKSRLKFDAFDASSGGGWILYRKNFAQALVAAGEKRGVEYQFGSVAQRLLFDSGAVVGVEGALVEPGQSPKDGIHFTVKSQVLVDGSGYVGILRRQLPDTDGFQHVEKELDPNDRVSTTRQIIRLHRPEKVDPRHFHPSKCILHFDQVKFPGTYGWTFAVAPDVVNVGTAIQLKSHKKRNMATGLTDTLADLQQQYVESMFGIQGRDWEYANGHNAGNVNGTWNIPVRTQTSMAGPGWLGVGDAIYAPKSDDAGGIRAGLETGISAGTTAAVVVKPLDSGHSPRKVGLEETWLHNLLYQRGGVFKHNGHTVEGIGYGRNMAAKELLRIGLQGFSNEDFNIGALLVPRSDEKRVSLRQNPRFKKGEIALHLVTRPSKLARVVANWGRARSVATRLEYLDSGMVALEQYYAGFPLTPDGFEEWYKPVRNKMREARGLFDVDNPKAEFHSPGWPMN